MRDRKHVSFEGVVSGVRVGDCILWEGGLSYGRPVMLHPDLPSSEGKKVLVCRYIMGRKHGVKLDKGDRITHTCGNERCIISTHMVLDRVVDRHQARQKASKASSEALFRAQASRLGLTHLLKPEGSTD